MHVNLVVYKVAHIADRHRTRCPMNAGNVKQSTKIDRLFFCHKSGLKPQALSLPDHNIVHQLSL